MFKQKRYSIVFQNYKGVTQYIIIAARNENKARAICKEMYGKKIDILNISKKRDSSLAEDDNWA